MRSKLAGRSMSVGKAFLGEKQEERARCQSACCTIMLVRPARLGGALKQGSAVAPLARKQGVSPLPLRAPY